MKEDIFLDSRGGYHPRKILDFDPIFVWPPKPKAFLAWLLKFPGYIWPWNLFYIGIAFISYYFFQPAMSSWSTFNLDWILIVFFRNVFLIILLASFWHTRFFILKSQDDKFKYNLSPLGKEKKAWFLGSQTKENIFWSVFSAAPIMTAYEVFVMWAFANDYLLFSMLNWIETPILFCLIFLLIPVWQVFHFYVTHRISHWKIFYKTFHFLHHRNVNTGPWSGLSMHPIEHVFYFSTLLIHFVVPTHPIHFIFHIQQTALRAIQGHSGYDQLVINKKSGYALPNASYFHYLHHKYFECNYGELTIPLDKWFGSFHNGTKDSHKKLFRN